MPANHEERFEASKFQQKTLHELAKNTGIAQYLRSAVDCPLYACLGCGLPQERESLAT